MCISTLVLVLINQYSTGLLSVNFISWQNLIVRNLIFQVPQDLRRRRQPRNDEYRAGDPLLKVWEDCRLVFCWRRWRKWGPKAVTPHRHCISFVHRYLKNIDCLSFVVCLLIAPHLPNHFLPFFVAAINSTNEANKAGGTCHKAVIFGCLRFRSTWHKSCLRAPK